MYPTSQNFANDIAPLLLLILLLSGCSPKDSDSGEDTSSNQDTSADSGEPVDSGDDTSNPEETGDTDSDFPAISGDCFVLDDELTDTAPSVFSNSIDFGEIGFSEDYLSEGGNTLYASDNAGGSSVYSEVFAFELLHRCEEALLLKTETEITYTDSQGKITDMLLEIDSLKIGVSVTRAFAYPPETPYTNELAEELLEKKLAGVLESSANVSPEDAWEKQILYILAYTPDHQARVLESYQTLDPSLTADTIVVVTSTEGEDTFLY